MTNTTHFLNLRDQLCPEGKFEEPTLQFRLKKIPQDGLKEARGAGVGLVQYGFKGSLNLMWEFCGIKVKFQL